MMLRRVRSLVPPRIARPLSQWRNRWRSRRSDDIALVFNAFGRGSPEHYYHFFWGYLLPGLSLIRASGLKGRFLLQDCGPVMNPLWQEMAELLELEISILPKGRTPRARFCWNVPRWDTFLVLTAEAGARRSHHDLARLVQQRMQGSDPMIRQTLTAPGGSDHVGARMRALRDDLLPLLLAGAARQAPGRPDHAPYLLLQRSEEPTYYKADGAARIKHYGAARRSITDLDAALEALRARGYRVAAFDCGAYSLAEQARAFASCRGLAMIRGAEVANFIWLSPGTPVHVICPPMSPLKPHDALAPVFGLGLTEQPVDEMHAALDIEAVAAAWGPPR